MANPRMADYFQLDSLKSTSRSCKRWSLTLVRISTFYFFIWELQMFRLQRTNPSSKSSITSPLHLIRVYLALSAPSWNLFLILSFHGKTVSRNVLALDRSIISRSVRRAPCQLRPTRLHLRRCVRLLSSWCHGNTAVLQMPRYLEFSRNAHIWADRATRRSKKKKR